MAVSVSLGARFALMEDARSMDLMHEECARIADPPYHRLGFRPMWRSVATIIDMPPLLQAEHQCAWCARTLSDPPDPERT